MVQWLEPETVNRENRCSYSVPMLSNFAHIALCRDLSTRHLDRYKQLWIGRNMGGRGKKMKEQKKVFQNYCQLCIRSERKWCHMCVCSPFQSINQFNQSISLHCP